MHLVLILKAIVMGIVEGITEFLPISSTGHLILVGNFIHFGEPSVSKAYVDMFEVVIQLGAILAIVVLYWNKIVDSFRNLSGYGLKLWINIFVAFLPAAIVGLLTDKYINKYLFGPTTVIAALIVGALLMLYMEKKYRKNSVTRRIDDVNMSQAIRIGIFQCLSLWPGMSRSASTIMGGWFSGLDNVAAAEFSFFLAIPTMVAASGYDLLKTMKTSSGVFTSGGVIALVIGFVVAFIVALIVVEKFIAFLKRKPMRIFAIYRLAIGILLIILSAAGTINFGK